MSASLARTVSLYAALLALFSLATALRRKGLGRAHAGAAIVLGAGTLLDALVALIAIATGERPDEHVPFAGYLLLSALAVPVGWRYARASPRGWDAAIFALAAAALCVIGARLVRTWG
jgi:hypothetical protein